jgi:hypothetical protein
MAVKRATRMHNMVELRRGWGKARRWPRWCTHAAAAGSARACCARGIATERLAPALRPHSGAQAHRRTTVRGDRTAAQGGTRRLKEAGALAAVLQHRR